jgi:NAD(P)-dependent dehydrogenase (short-subunit alcohol dehydrogenase family)
MQDRMTGRRALITGAGGGIGRAAALRLASEGARIAAVDFRADALEALEAEFSRASADPTRFLACPADVADPQQIEAAVQAAVTALGGLDTIVISAGISIPGELHELPLERWHRVIDINLHGAFYTLRYAIPHLLAAGGGCVVTIGSVASLVAAGNAPSYDASKGAILQLTRSVAVNYAERGIRANCICPGPIDTDIKANSTTVSGVERPLTPTSTHRVQNPTPRLGTAEEVAALIAFLCSEEATFITGAALPIDGGWTAI